MKKAYDTVTELLLEHQYPPERIEDMGESGFAVGTTQTSIIATSQQPAAFRA